MYTCCSIYKWTHSTGIIHLKFYWLLLNIMSPDYSWTQVLLITPEHNAYWLLLNIMSWIHDIPLQANKKKSSNCTLAVKIKYAMGAIAWQSSLRRSALNTCTADKDLIDYLFSSVFSLMKPQNTCCYIVFLFNTCFRLCRT